MTTTWAGEAPAAPVPEVGREWATGPLGEVQQHALAIGRRTAAQARAVAAFARDRPSAADRQPGEPGCASAASRNARPEVLEQVSEWAAQELAVALQLTQQSAVALLTRSVTLVDRLPATLTALETGTVHPGHLWAFTERVGSIVDRRVRARIEREVLAWMVGRVTTPGQLAERVRVLVLRHDAAGAAQRLADAIRTRGVFVAPGRADGLAQLTAVLTTPEARACLDALGRCADALDDEATPGPDGATRPPRTRAQKMADCLVDLILRPGETDLPVVTAQLTVVASIETLAGGDQPGEIDGQVVPAEMVRHLARALGLVPGHTAPAPCGVLAPENVPAPGEAARPASRSSSAGARGAAASGWQARSSPGEDVPPDPLLHLYGQLEGGVVGDAEWAGLVAAWTELGTPDPREGDGLPERNGPDWPRWDAVSSTGIEFPGGVDSSRDSAGWATADAAVWAASEAMEHARSEVVRARIAVRAAEFAATTVEAAHQSSAAGFLGRARDTIEALSAQHRELQSQIGALLLRSAGGGLADRPRVAVVDALSGTLLVLTDAPELRRAAACGRDACVRRAGVCTHDLTGRPGVGAPGASPGYRPGRALDRFVRARDRRCRFPGCRARVPRGGQLDHDRRWPEGHTSAGNLVGYCTRHHRGKPRRRGGSTPCCPTGA